MDISFYNAATALGALCTATIFHVFGVRPYVDTLATSPRVEGNSPEVAPLTPPKRFARPAYSQRLPQEYTAPFIYHITSPILDQATRGVRTGFFLQSHHVGSRPTHSATPTDSGSRMPSLKRYTTHWTCDIPELGCIHSYSHHA